MSSLSKLLASAFDLSEVDQAIRLLSENAVIQNVPANQRLFSSGDPAENFVLIANGSAKVQISTKSGREMILFRLSAGESCALTTSCLLANSPYYAEGVSETEIGLITIPAAAFRQVLGQFPNLALYLIDDYAARIGQLTGVIDRLISRDLSGELKNFLLDQVNQAGIVNFSHQKIAEELGSSREVISRKLKRMESSGLIKLSRGKIYLRSLSL